MVVGMGSGVTMEYEEEWAFWLLSNIFFPRFWFEVEESEEWVCKLCWFYLDFFIIVVDSKTRLLLLLLLLLLLYGKTGIC